MRIRLLFIALVIAEQLSALSVSSLYAGEDRLELYSWWNAGGDSVALEALVGLYKKANPGTEVVSQTIGGTGGIAARAVLQTRLNAGNPPDTWQSHPGWELFGQYVDRGYCEPIDSVYDSEGWNHVFPANLIPLLSERGRKYEVLVGIHRGNVLWYDKKVLDKLHIHVGANLSFDALIAACDKLEAAGISGIAVGDLEITNSAQVFENTLIGVIGPDGWTDLFDGKLQWDSPQVKLAMQMFGEILDRQNPDHASLDLYGALRELISGKAGFTCAGDWTYGAFLRSNQKPNVDFGWVCYPAHLMNQSTRVRRSSRLNSNRFFPQVGIRCCTSASGPLFYFRF